MTDKKKKAKVIDRSARELRELEMQKKGLWSVAAVAKKFNISRATIYTWVRSGALKPQPFGMRSYYLKAEELCKLIPEMKHEASSR